MLRVLGIGSRFAVVRRAILATLVVGFVVLPQVATAATGGSDRPMRVWARTGVHSIGAVSDPARCPQREGLILVFQTFLEGGGNATHVGEYRFAGDHCTYLDPGSGNLTYSTGNWVLTASNGDRFFAPYQDSGAIGAPDPQADISTVASHQILGGTGRFEGATGSMMCAIQLAITDPVTFTADLWGTCTGTISY